ncbi:hypothetical protein ACS0TY_006983 [Phlomoides rotata]
MAMARILGLLKTLIILISIAFFKNLVHVCNNKSPQKSIKHSIHHTDHRRPLSLIQRLRSRLAALSSAAPSPHARSGRRRSSFPNATPIAAVSPLLYDFKLGFIIISDIFGALSEKNILPLPSGGSWRSTSLLPIRRNEDFRKTTDKRWKKMRMLEKGNGQFTN